MTHVHHWILDTPNGSPMIDGYCKDCGGHRRYSASIDERTWGGWSEESTERGRVASNGKPKIRKPAAWAAGLPTEAAR
jgi:hypothetical protein